MSTGMSDGDQRLDQLVEAVLRSGKYRRIDPGFVRDVGRRELAKRRNVNEAIKATKRKLHQVVAAYQERAPESERWLAELSAAYESGDGERIRAASREIMRGHASTRERLPILDEFYDAVFELLPPVRSVLDLACGLNPLAIPWMSLAEGASYRAIDIDRCLIDFLNRFFAVAPIEGVAEVRDVTRELATIEEQEMVDLALVLKSIPCLEQIDRDAGARLLDNVRARHLVVSFPGRSLGGRGKGMPATYRAHFEALINDRGTVLARLDYPSELVFVVALARQQA